MEVIELTIPYQRTEVFRFYPIGDIHYGSVHCAEDEIQKEVDKIKQTPRSYIIGMGDMCDAILKEDKRFDILGLAPWIERDNILDSQRLKVVSLLKPVKDKVVCLLEGNHERTIHQRYQNHIIKNICTDLDVPFGGYHAFILLKFKRNKSNESYNYTIHAWHGSGAAQTEGARLNRLIRLVNDIQADIYLMGHLHAMTQHTPDRLMIKNGKIKSVELAATITGSWVKAYTQGDVTSYAEEKGYKPSRIGCPVICIKPNDQNFWIES